MINVTIYNETEEGGEIVHMVPEFGEKNDMTCMVVEKYHLMIWNFLLTYHHRLQKIFTFRWGEVFIGWNQTGEVFIGWNTFLFYFIFQLEIIHQNHLHKHKTHVFGYQHFIYGSINFCLHVQFLNMLSLESEFGLKKKTDKGVKRLSSGWQLLS